MYGSNRSPRLPGPYRVAPSQRRLLPLWLAFCLAFALGCSEELEALPPEQTEPDPVVPTTPRSAPNRGGVLASAGPDQRARPGMQVVLDSRASIGPEDGRPFTRLWVQEAGPPVALDDPTGALTSFIAPSRQAQASDTLLFRLILDDGIQRSHDRVAVRLVDHASQLLPAPVALGGADQEVRPGALVALAVPHGEQPTWATPLFLDPACHLMGGGPDCAEGLLPHCWTQVEGSPVKLEDPCGGSPSFLAPEAEDVITFRLDAHREDDGTNRSLGCGPTSWLVDERPDCAAVDYVRIFVRRAAWRTLPPTGKINFPEEIPRSGAIMRMERISSAYPSQVRLSATAFDPIYQELNTFYGFRPLLGDAPPGNLISFELLFPRSPGWPRVEGVVFESQFRRLRAAPAPAILVWLPPSDRGPLVVDAGPAPCSAASDQWCEPPFAGEEIRLEGSVQGSPSPGSLVWCWEQIAGPAVDLDPPGPCVEGVASRSFIAPSPGEGIPYVDLSFQLVAREGGPLTSPPDVVAVRIRAEEPEPPFVTVAAPLEVRAETSALLDASRSGSPSQTPVAIRWRQILEPGAIPVELQPAESCFDAEAAAGACRRLLAPRAAVGGNVELEVIATDANGISSTRRIQLPVVE